MTTTGEAAVRSGEGRGWDRPLRLTALYHEHVLAGAELVERDGWLLPRSYGNPPAERAALREAVGLFDIGESGKIDLKSNALDAVLAHLYHEDGETRGEQRTPCLRVSVVSDKLQVCRLTDAQALLLTPSDAVEETLAALGRIAAADACAHATDLTGALCAVRLLGPAAPSVLERLSSLDLAPDRFADGALAQGGIARIHALVARRDTGGLIGYDLYVDRDLGAYLWRTLLEQGAPLVITPVGRDNED